MENREDEFQLEEYKALRAELGTMLSLTSTLAQYTLVAVASVFAWLATKSIGIDPSADSKLSSHWCIKLPVELIGPAWYIPGIFAILAGLVALASVLRAKHIGRYIEKLEDYFQPREHLGWERNIHDPKGMLNVNYPTAAVILFWAVVICGSCIAAYEANRFFTECSGMSKYPPCKTSGSVE